MDLHSAHNSEDLTCMISQLLKLQRETLAICQLQHAQKVVDRSLRGSLLNPTPLTQVKAFKH